MPSVERADMFPLPGGVPIQLVTSLELVSEVHAFLGAGLCPARAVQVLVLTELLRAML